MSNHIEMVPSAPVEKIVIHRKDGTTKEITRGFVATYESGEDESTVTLHGCNISGPQLIDLAVTVLAPIADQYFGDDDEEEV